VDYWLFVIDVAGGDDIPRKRGPGVIRCDLLVVTRLISRRTFASTFPDAEGGQQVRSGRPVTRHHASSGEGIEALMDVLDGTCCSCERRLWQRLDLVFAMRRRAHLPDPAPLPWPLLIGGSSPTARPGVGSVTIQNCAGTVIPVMSSGSGSGGRRRVGGVRGQGATTVTGVHGGEPAAEDTRLRVDASSRCCSTLAAHPHRARGYRQRTGGVCRAGWTGGDRRRRGPHPDLTDEAFGATSPVSPSPPRTERSSTRCANARDDAAGPPSRRLSRTVYVVGGGFDKT